ncbi:nucleotidyltransferase substrate binding protein [Ectothiorhodospira haloalkaliphila]|uniref:nucleotidyltransferase substrate binding protein n=1 Tax=Ectothiorhodospira haloalkaliphila TaxID=421628 RepID=UPI001EE89CC1|nr:nucleotidyltransferase substrate binding protein [Ectothiorhodospira haloalkaliphila]
MKETRLDLTPLRQAITSLQEGITLVDDTHWFNAQPATVQRTLMAGVIQNFEFVYEISIKMLRRQLELEAASPEEVDHSHFRDLLRTAGEKGLIRDVAAWFHYRTMRNITSHTYNQEKAREVFQGTRAFIHDARHLLEQLDARNR